MKGQGCFLQRGEESEPVQSSVPALAPAPPPLRPRPRPRHAVQVGGGRPALGVRVARQPHVPPARAPRPHQRHHLARVQVQLARRERRVVGQRAVQLRRVRVELLHAGAAVQVAAAAARVAVGAAPAVTVQAARPGEREYRDI